MDLVDESPCAVCRKWECELRVLNHFSCEHTVCVDCIISYVLNPALYLDEAAWRALEGNGEEHRDYSVVRNTTINVLNGRFAACPMCASASVCKRLVPL